MEYRDDEWHLLCAKALAASQQSGIQQEDEELTLGCAVCRTQTCHDGHFLLQCSGCLATYYCSQEHQTAHWRLGKHKSACKHTRRLWQRYQTHAAMNTLASAEYSAIDSLTLLHATYGCGLKALSVGCAKEGKMWFTRSLSLLRGALDGNVASDVALRAALCDVFYHLAHCDYSADRNKRAYILLEQVLLLHGVEDACAVRITSHLDLTDVFALMGRCFCDNRRMEDGVALLLKSCALARQIGDQHTVQSTSRFLVSKLLRDAGASEPLPSDLRRRCLSILEQSMDGWESTGDHFEGAKTQYVMSILYDCGQDRDGGQKLAWAALRTADRCTGRFAARMKVVVASTLAQQSAYKGAIKLVEALLIKVRSAAAHAHYSPSCSAEVYKFCDAYADVAKYVSEELIRFESLPDGASMYEVGLKALLLTGACSKDHFQERFGRGALPELPRECWTGLGIHGF